MLNRTIAGAICALVAVAFFSPNEVRAAAGGRAGVAGARPAAAHVVRGRFSANRFHAANFRRFPHRRIRGFVAPWGWWPDCTAYGTCDCTTYGNCGYDISEDQPPVVPMAPARVYQPSCQLQSRTHTVHSERDGGERKITIIGCSTASGPSTVAVTK
jgi:hypothetical protein